MHNQLIKIIIPVSYIREYISAGYSIINKRYVHAFWTGGSSNSNELK